MLQMVTFPLIGSGSGVYVDQLSERLTERGHHVRVLCADHNPPQRRYPVEAILFSNGENHVHDLDFNFPAFTSHPVSTQTTFGTLTDSQRQAFCAVFRDKIARAVNDFKPDLIHVHHGWVMGWVVADLGVPYVITLHGTEHLGFTRYPAYREMALKALRGARLIAALTPVMREEAISTYEIDPARFTIVTTGIDTRTYRPVEVDKEQALQQHGLQDTGRPIVLFAGKLAWFKGVDMLLRAAATYSRSEAKPITLIAGDGDLRLSLEALANELKLDSVHFLGHQDQQSMVSLYNIADLLAFPSTTDFFPLVGLEALACGTPIVATDVGAFRQVINDQVGYLVPPGNPAALAEQIIVALRGQLKARGRQAIAAHVQQHFSLDSMTSRYEEVYQAALAT